MSTPIHASHIFASTQAQPRRTVPDSAVGDDARAKTIRMVTDLLADATRRYERSGCFAAKGEADGHALRLKDLEGGHA